ncbi:CLUMA_CG012177, isoform A [Clunio marinus]|uniref:CLUMA_CG012177, isoform A n=1 Tax=Clunio marinus TaxID=568069 RepID=A0A1J1IKZ5_9DIPT|nr:CLUMA_CG012177, isoform A [Clunio marinus]
MAFSLLRFLAEFLLFTTVCGGNDDEIRFHLSSSFFSVVTAKYVARQNIFRTLNKCRHVNSKRLSNSTDLDGIQWKISPVLMTTPNLDTFFDST